MKLQSWQANWKLGKLIYVFDDNNISIDGNVDKVSITNQKNKFESLGWHVQEIDAHSEQEIISAINHGKIETSKPSLIIAKSTIGKFSPNKQNTSSVHGSPLGKNEMELFLQNIGWTGDVFTHNRDIYEYFSDKREEDLINFENWSANLNNKLQDKTFKELWDKFSNFQIYFLRLI